MTVLLLRLIDPVWSRDSDSEVTDATSDGRCVGQTAASALASEAIPNARRHGQRSMVDFIQL